jgi:hypothetical protein
MAVRRVDDEHVDAGVDERLRPVEVALARADGGADAQPAVLVLRRIGELPALEDVLDRDQAAQPALLVDDGQLLDALPVQDALGLLERRADGCRDEAVLVMTSRIGLSSSSRTGGRGS